MQIKKAWTCNNQCKTNCCQELFLVMNEKQHLDYLNKGFYFVKKNYCEWRWISFRDAITYKRIGKLYKIMVNKSFEQRVIFNPLINNWILHIKNDCDKLLQDNKCKVYRNRPMTCKHGECPVYSDKPKIVWLAEKGLLKKVRKKMYVK